MKAVILAGGLGTRLRSAVGDLPKAMAPIDGKPFLAYQLALLRREGISEAVLAVGYGGKTIQEYFGSGDAVGTRLTYSMEETPLGTAGAVREAAKLFEDESFLVLNGDTFFDASLVPLLNGNVPSPALATVGLVMVPDAARFGSVALENDGRVSSFQEKGVQGEGLINAGVYLLRRPMLDRIPASGASSLEREIFPRLAEVGRLAGCILDGFHLDIGTPESFQKAQTALPARVSLSPAGPGHRSE